MLKAGLDSWTQFLNDCHTEIKRTITIVNVRRQKGTAKKGSREKRKLKPRLEMLKDQKGNTLPDQEEIKGRWKLYTENQDRRDKRMTDTFWR